VLSAARQGGHPADPGKAAWGASGGDRRRGYGLDPNRAGQAPRGDTIGGSP